MISIVIPTLSSASNFFTNLEKRASFLGKPVLFFKKIHLICSAARKNLAYFLLAEKTDFCHHHQQQSQNPPISSSITKMMLLMLLQQQHPSRHIIIADAPTTTILLSVVR